MDTGTTFNGRFCWPAEDRVRTGNPLTVPRISPVFTASVFSTSEFRVRSSLPATSPAVHRLSACSAPNIPGQLSGLRGMERRLGCQVGLTSQLPLSPWIQTRPRAGGSGPGESGVALALPDWRILGEQDFS